MLISALERSMPDGLSEKATKKPPDDDFLV